jgi:hypothetical protein
LVAFAINRSCNQSTRSSPFEIILGYNPASPFERLLKFKPESRESNIADWRKEKLQQLQQVLHALQVAQNRMIASSSGHRPTLSLQVGDLVWLSTKHLKLNITGSRKLTRRYIGPFPVIKVVNPVTYKLQLPTQLKIHPVFHISELSKVRPNTRLPPEPIIMEVEGHDEFFIDSILAHKVQTRRTKHTLKSQYLYLTSFQNEGPEENRWLSEADFTSDGKYKNPILDTYKRLHHLSDPVTDDAVDKQSDSPAKKRTRR